MDRSSLNAGNDHIRRSECSLSIRALTFAGAVTDEVASRLGSISDVQRPAQAIRAWLR